MASSRLHTVTSHVQGTVPPPFVVIKEDVRRAQAQGRPVVALESTIITHGMPYPANKETAKQVEGVIRDNGAVPATIAIINGAVHIGLTDDEIEFLATHTSQVAKCSRRNLGHVIATKGHGSTTVAATMILAHIVGIRVFVTGGIGGVHRGAEHTMDISADLLELGRTPVTVVCAGAKSILDIPKTLEVLETQGVTVVGYQVDEFPAFFTRHSGCRAPMRLDTPQEIASVVSANHALGLSGGCLVGNPIPAHLEADTKKVTDATTVALQEAEAAGISGHEVTPFLLKRIHDISGGESLRANVELIRNNARVGAQIACALVGQNT